MPAACGIACEICVLHAKEICPPGMRSRERSEGASVHGDAEGIGYVLPCA